jgi:hypothetical protein
MKRCAVRELLARTKRHLKNQGRLDSVWSGLTSAARATDEEELGYSREV